MFASKLARASARTFSTSAFRADVARMTLLGRVTKSPEQLLSKNGNEYIKYALAVNHSKEQSSFFNVLVFDQALQEFVSKWVDKGSLIYLEADASINKYTNENGVTSYNLTLIQQTINPITWPKRESSDESLSETKEA